jgi:hypothetical protein
MAFISSICPTFPDCDLLFDLFDHRVNRGGDFGTQTVAPFIALRLDAEEDELLWFFSEQLHQRQNLVE